MEPTPPPTHTRSQMFAGVMFWLVFVAFLVAAFLQGPQTGFVVLGIEALVLCLIYGIGTPKK